MPRTQASADPARRAEGCHGEPAGPLTAADALSLRFEKLIDVLPLREPRRMPGGAAMLEVGLVVGCADDAADDSEQLLHEGRRAAVPPCRHVSLPPHTHSPHTAPRVRRPPCVARARATTRAATSRSGPSRPP